jgi:COP9 signalosome complex subunit 3
MTSHHLSLVKLALNSDNIDQALPVLEKTIVFYPGIWQNTKEKKSPCDTSLSPAEYITAESGLTEKISSTHILQYDLLSAMCFMARKSWRKAFDALERVLTYPTKDGGCSKIMVEAHNKWVLVGLLLTGKTPTVPSITSQTVQKTYQTLGKPYLAIAKAFEQDKADNLKTELDALGQAFWVEEGNLGLVQEVVAHYQRWQILNLRDVYSKISLEQIRTQTQSGETASPLENVSQIDELLRDMIREGMLNGSVERPSGGPAHLVFNDAEERTEAQVVADITKAATAIAQLEPLVKETNERIATSREYIRHLVRESKRKEEQGTHGNGLDNMDDEDLMTGISAA